MPAAAVLAFSIIAGLNGVYVAAHNTAAIVKAVHAIHHHTTRPMYRHVLKPVGKGVAKGVVKGVVN